MTTVRLMYLEPNTFSKVPLNVIRKILLEEDILADYIVRASKNREAYVNELLKDSTFVIKMWNFKRDTLKHLLLAAPTATWFVFITKRNAHALPSDLVMYLANTNPSLLENLPEDTLKNVFLGIPELKQNVFEVLQKKHNMLLGFLQDTEIIETLSEKEFQNLVSVIGAKEFVEKLVKERNLKLLEHGMLLI